MRSALRSAASVIAGFIAASIVMMAVETINGRVLYPGLAKAAEGVTDRETVRALLAAAPLGAFLVVIAGWILGGAVGGWATARLAPRATIGHGLVLGVDVFTVDGEKRQHGDERDAFVPVGIRVVPGKSERVGRRPQTARDR